MRKILFLFSILCFNIAAIAQNKTTLDKQKVVENAQKAAAEYVKRITGDIKFDQYFTFNNEDSEILLNSSINNFKANNFGKNEAIGFKICIEVKRNSDISQKDWDFKYTLYINKDFEVDFEELWNSSGISYAEGNYNISFNVLPEDAMKKFIAQMYDFSKKINDNKTNLKEADVLAFVKKSYPGKEFRAPVMTRNSLPPYNVFWEVSESNCKSCKRYEVEVDALKISNEREFTVNYLN
jgi:hypothetical protein